MLKNALYFLVLVITVTACSKGDGLGIGPKNNVDAATRASGTYAISRYAVSGSGADDFDFTLPRTLTINGQSITQSGRLVVAKSAETTLAVKLVIVVSGQADSESDLGTVDITGTDLLENGVKLGTADGSAFNLDFTASGVRYIILSKK